MFLSSSLATFGFAMTVQLIANLVTLVAVFFLQLRSILSIFCIYTKRNNFSKGSVVSVSEWLLGSFVLMLHLFNSTNIYRCTETVVPSLFGIWSTSILLCTNVP